MIQLKIPQMQGARFLRNEEYLIVRRCYEEIEATQQMVYFQRNHRIVLGTSLQSPSRS